VDGNEIPFASKWTASFGGDLTLAEIGTGKVVLNAEVAYKSSFWYDAFNGNDRPNPTGLYPADPAHPGLGRSNLVGSDGYALVNGRLSYSTDRFSISAWGKNIFNKKYYPFGYDTAGAFGTVLLTPGTPRTYGVEATVKF
jgi:iron complex outermembrane receptor protein